MRSGVEKSYYRIRHASLPNLPTFLAANTDWTVRVETTGSTPTQAGSIDRIPPSSAPRLRAAESRFSLGTGVAPRLILVLAMLSQAGPLSLSSIQVQCGQLEPCFGDSMAPPPSRKDRFFHLWGLFSQRRERDTFRSQLWEARAKRPVVQYSWRTGSGLRPLTFVYLV